MKRLKCFMSQDALPLISDTTNIYLLSHFRNALMPHKRVFKTLHSWGKISGTLRIERDTLKLLPEHEGRAFCGLQTPGSYSFQTPLHQAWARGLLRRSAWCTLGGFWMEVSALESWILCRWRAFPCAPIRQTQFIKIVLAPFIQSFKVLIVAAFTHAEKREKHILFFSLNFCLAETFPNIRA